MLCCPTAQTVALIEGQSALTIHLDSPDSKSPSVNKMIDVGLRLELGGQVLLI